MSAAGAPAVPRASGRATVTAAALSPDLQAGVRAMLPMIVASVPFGLVVGAAAARSDAPPAAWLATWGIYGGAAHLAVLDMAAHGSGWLAAAAVGLLVNVRLSAYATAMASRWRSAPVGRRLVAGLLLTDAPWPLAHSRARGHRASYLGAAGVLFLAWPPLVTLGMLVGDRVDAVPVTGLLSAMTLGGVVVSRLRVRPAAAAATAAAAVAVLTTTLPVGWALAASATAGSVAFRVVPLLGAALHLL